MEMIFYGYPKCGTCRKAEKWLNVHEFEFRYVNVAENPPSKIEIEEFYKKSGLPLKKFFNTSGKVYRELGLKDKLKTANEEDMLGWLASNGMLLKRPIVTDGNQVTIGFRESQFEEAWTN